MGDGNWEIFIASKNFMESQLETRQRSDSEEQIEVPRRSGKSAWSPQWLSDMANGFFGQLFFPLLRQNGTRHFFSLHSVPTEALWKTFQGFSSKFKCWRCFWMFSSGPISWNGVEKTRETSRNSIFQLRIHSHTLIKSFVETLKIYEYLEETFSQFFVALLSIQFHSFHVIYLIDSF